MCIHPDILCFKTCPLLEIFFVNGIGFARQVSISLSCIGLIKNCLVLHISVHEFFALRF